MGGFSFFFSSTWSNSPSSTTENLEIHPPLKNEMLRFWHKYEIETSLILRNTLAVIMEASPVGVSYSVVRNQI